MSTDTDRHVGPVTAAELWRIAAALPGWDAAACTLVARCVSALCSARAEVLVQGPSRLAPTLGPPEDDVVLTLAARDGGEPCAWLELEGSLARAVVDLALGGTADTAELAHVEPLDPTRMGVLLYMVACALTAVPQDALRIVDLGRASDVPRPARVACAARLTLQGRVYGARLSVSVEALPSLSSLPSTLTRAAQSVPAWAREATCVVTLELARGALEAGCLAGLEPGDVVVPHAVLAEPGAWETAALRCDAFDRALASVRRDPSGALHLRPMPHDAGTEGLAADAEETLFTVEAARVRAPLVDVARWLSEGRLPLDVDPHAPLTLWSEGHALAHGRLVRDRSDVGLCVESVRRFEPDTRPY